MRFFFFEKIDAIDAHNKTNKHRQSVYNLARTRSFLLVFDAHREINHAESRLHGFAFRLISAFRNGEILLHSQLAALPWVVKHTRYKLHNSNGELCGEQK